MPELPEVETIRRSLLPLLPGKKIEEAQIFLEKAVKPSPEAVRDGLIGREIMDIKRRGKYLIIQLDNEQWVTIHLRMSGRLVFMPASAPLEKHTTLTLEFTDGNSLRFVDPRKFGTVVLHAPTEPPAGLSTLGPEPLTTPKAEMLERLQTAAARRPGPVKGMLLDQRVLAGLGNIYVDEALFLAGVRPERPANGICAAEWEKIYESMLKVLNDSIEHRGTSERDYVDGLGEPGYHQVYLQVYGRKREPCRKCGTELIYTRVAGRGTHYCPNCQS
ncbi:MAG: bifunctional DNA-formamidopyrimidine glycosylase/DNA-(apurinic or apyrimidinic site) lyase [Firmicutes bacterium]|nr:bifunctional DNA-formamidopyrimidine glycosylase/DNA-(apurinic or apyrimidinic site) lyase [Bacillota bacterium]